MKIPNNNICPETIDFYMQKSQQERSEAILNACKWIKRSIKYAITILRSSKCVDCDNKRISDGFRDQVTQANQREFL